MSRDDAALVDMLNSCRAALEFLGPLDRDSFLSDRKTQSAILHQLLILGEATKRLSPSFRQAHPRMPWREITGMRDRLIHAYDRVDVEMVWTALNKRLPSLLAFLEQQAAKPPGGETNP